jgi:Uma2 family endonuclease
MSVLRRWTVEEYEEIHKTHVFEGLDKPRVELIRGEICEMSPIGPAHLEIVQRLNRWSHFSPAIARVRVSVQDPIDLVDLDSVPQPDIVWLLPRDYRAKRPTPRDVLLIIEVAVTTLLDDLGEKCLLYAEAGIEEYWVVDVAGQRVVVHRDPSPTGYQTVLERCRGESIGPAAFPDAVLEVEMLFA